MCETNPANWLKTDGVPDKTVGLNCFLTDGLLRNNLRSFAACMAGFTSMNYGLFSGENLMNTSAKQEAPSRWKAVLLIASMAFTALISGQAGAQDNTQPTTGGGKTEESQNKQKEDKKEDKNNQEENKSVDLGRVEVTGSLIKREDFVSTSPVQIINAETQAQVGQLEMADILQSSTVAAGTTQLNNQFNGFVIQGGTGVQTLNLRGLGATRTLVLLNGRRTGGSGVRGQTQSLDLATLPEIAVQRVELVLDGSSSIYGSDAVAGVANIITRRQVDGFEVNALTELPEAGGGEMYRIGFINGWNFEKGNATLSAQWQKRNPLEIGDRDFLSCPRDLYRDANGNIIDREDRSITAGTRLSGCQNLYHNTILDLVTGDRLVPSWDGTTIGPIPGYRPRENGRYDDEEGQAFYNDVLTAEFTQSEYAINRQERLNVYATMDYSLDAFGGSDWDADFLYSNRKTTAKNWRQFFPLIGSPFFRPYEDNPDYFNGLIASIPVMPYPSNTEVDVDFYYFTTGLEGVLPTEKYWNWRVTGSYSYSDGSYTRNSILASRSADVSLPGGQAFAPVVDYFSPGILSGENMDELINAIGIIQTGNTIYDQVQVNAILSGDVVELPAGTMALAGGIEYRRFSIDDQPSEASRSGDLWGESSALVTKGTNDVTEIFAEAEIPLLAGLPAVEDLTLSLSARAFDYKYGGSDVVWKAGMAWRVTPTFMFRSTAGTSYRAPALFELFLGNETSFVGQLSIDPCINWGESTNELIRQNCAAEGIPPDYPTGPTASATVISGGGAENLEPETSKAFTFGLVWTPEFTDLSVAIDYIDIEVNNQISQLGAGAILSGCYNSENFPNAFCDLFTRAPGDDPQFPYNIQTVTDTFININQQKYQGVDLNLLWHHNMDIGRVEVALQSTWNLENIQRLFDPDQVQGFDTVDSVGTIGSPKVVSNLRTTFSRSDWRFNYSWYYVSSTDNSPFVDAETSYFGFAPAYRDIYMDSAVYHNVSVLYEQSKWDVLFGIKNLLDAEPDVVSAGVASRRGNVPIAATQYDLLGRTYFLRFNYRF